MSDFYDSLENIKLGLEAKSKDFVAGQIRFCISEWENITSDSEILKMVSGVDIEFNQLPVQDQPIVNHCLSKQQTAVVDDELSDLLKKGVVRQVGHSDQEYISPIFLVPKKENKWRMILNLKKLNLDVEYQHFKMETLKDALALVTPNCFFCSLDLKDAYFSVHVNKTSQEYLKFLWKGQLYAFTAFPNGLACCPRLFTKLMKPVMAYLHSLGHVSTIFIDDTLLIAESVESCVENVQDSLDLLHRLGFVVHPQKSVLAPSHIITYLGFVLDSQTMTITPTEERARGIRDHATDLKSFTYAHTEG